MKTIAPRFSGVYFKFHDQWVDVTAQTEAATLKTQAQVRDAYAKARDKQAMFVNSKKVIANYGLPVLGTLQDEPVVLTDEHARQFKAANTDNQRRLLNKWFDGLWDLKHVEVETKDNLDLIL